MSLCSPPPPPLPSLPALRHLPRVLIRAQAQAVGVVGPSGVHLAPSGMVPAFPLCLWVACICSGVGGRRVIRNPGLVIDFCREGVSCRGLSSRFRFRRVYL